MNPPLSTQLFDLGVELTRAQVAEFQDRPEALIGMVEWNGKPVARVCAWHKLNKPGSTEEAHNWAKARHYAVTSTVCEECQKVHFTI